jgi:hypothetical protein
LQRNGYNHKGNNKINNYQLFQLKRITDGQI